MTLLQNEIVIHRAASADLPLDQTVPSPFPVSALAGVSTHPTTSSHVIRLHKVIDTFGCLFMVLDYCQGGDLFEQILKGVEKETATPGKSPESVDDNGRGGPAHVVGADSPSYFPSELAPCDLPPEKPISIFRAVNSFELVQDLMLQLVDGIEALHLRGIAHRDLKPENLFYVPSSDPPAYLALTPPSPSSARHRPYSLSKGLLMIGDFGLATMEVLSKDIGRGTSFYASPEACGFSWQKLLREAQRAVVDLAAAAPTSGFGGGECSYASSSSSSLDPYSPFTPYSAADQDRASNNRNGVGFPFPTTSAPQEPTSAFSPYTSYAPTRLDDDGGPAARADAQDSLPSPSINPPPRRSAAPQSAAMPFTYDAKRSDIWSFGIILINLIFHRNPWNIALPHVDETFRYYLHHQDSFFLQLLEEVDEDFEELLRGVLAINPEERWTWTQVREKIRSLTRFKRSDASENPSETHSPALEHLRGRGRELSALQESENDGTGSEGTVATAGSNSNSTTKQPTPTRSAIILQQTSSTSLSRLASRVAALRQHASSDLHPAAHLLAPSAGTAVPVARRSTGHTRKHYDDLLNISPSRMSFLVYDPLRRRRSRPHRHVCPKAEAIRSVQSFLASGGTTAPRAPSRSYRQKRLFFHNNNNKGPSPTRRPGVRAKEQNK